VSTYIDGVTRDLVPDSVTDPVRDSGTDTETVPVVIIGGGPKATPANSDAPSRRLESPDRRQYFLSWHVITTLTDVAFLATLTRRSDSLRFRLDRTR
jgi:hypothetical protein